MNGSVASLYNILRGVLPHFDAHSFVKTCLDYPNSLALCKFASHGKLCSKKRGTQSFIRDVSLIHYFGVQVINQGLVDCFYPHFFSSEMLFPELLGNLFVRAPVIGRQQRRVHYTIA